MYVGILLVHNHPHVRTSCDKRGPKIRGTYRTTLTAVVTHVRPACDNEGIHGQCIEGKSWLHIFIFSFPPTALPLRTNPDSTPNHVENTGGT